MKLKKIGLGILASAFIFTLTGCGKDARQEFIETTYSKDSSYNAAKFELGIDKFDFSSDEDGSAYVTMVANQLKDITLDGSYAVNEDDKTLEMEMNLNLLGETLPLQFVMADEKMYLSTSFVSGAVDIANSFQYPIDLSSAQLKKLEGKYIDIGAASSEFSGDKTSSSEEADAVGIYSDEKFQKEMHDLIGTFDKDSFTKKGDVITHTFTKDEVVKMLELMQSYAKKQKDTESETSAKKYIKTFKEDVDDVSIKVAVNTKNKETSCTIAILVKNDATEVDMAMTMKITPQKNKEKISVPTKKDILSEDEFNEILATIYNSAYGYKETTDNSYDDLYSDLYDDYSMSDEYFDQVIESIELYPEEISKEDADALRKSGSLVFSEDQMKRLNEALDKALL